MTHQDIASTLQKSLKVLSWATVALYLVVIVALVVVWRQSASTTQALCALRQDIERRAAAAEDFLTTHPNGIPGIPPATLQQSLEGQRRSVVALSGLQCD